MIVNKTTKAFQTRSDMPASNWLGDEWYVIEDNSPLAQKVMQLYPRFDFVLGDDSDLIDVVEIPKTQEEINAEREEEIKAELQNLDSTINRATEDLYVLTNTTPYEKVAEVIQQKEELRQELQTLQGVQNANNIINKRY